MSPPHSRLILWALLWKIATSHLQSMHISTKVVFHYAAYKDILPHLSLEAAFSNQPSRLSWLLSTPTSLFGAVYLYRVLS